MVPSSPNSSLVRGGVSAPATQQAVQDGRIHIEKINAPFLSREHVNAGRIQAIERGWLVLHESGTYVKFAQACGSVCLKQNCAA
jgi:hypothetical protein